MQIKCKCRFMDGKNEFHKDDVRTVSVEDGARFIANGWAEDTSVESVIEVEVTGDASLVIQSLTHNQSTVTGA